MYQYVVVWPFVDEEGYSFDQSQVCQNREEVETFKYNLEVMGIDLNDVKVYSLTEVNDI